MWITNELPEENRILIVYDMMSGLSIGYYDAKFQMFYTLSNEPLSNVSAWFYVPEKPKGITRVIDTVRQKNYINTIKKTEGGTKENV